MAKVKKNSGRTKRSSRRNRKKISEKEEDKLGIPCASRIKRKFAKGNEEKLSIPFSRRIRRKVVKQDEEKCMIPYVNNDVAINILTRIPADLLHKNFRYQCREWFDILSSPRFNDANSSHSKPGVIFTAALDDERSMVGFLEFYGLDLKVRELDVFEMKHIKIISSCRGLVLVKEVFNRDDPPWQKENPDDPVLFILNPATKESVSIPQCGHNCLWHELVFIPNTKEYKLVDMFYERVSYMRGTLAFHIRSIGGGWNESYHASDILTNVHVIDSYRDLDASSPWNERLSIDGVVYVNLVSKKKIIISFDLCNNKKVQLLELPAIRKNVRLINLSGSLSFVDCLDVSNSMGNFPLDVWVLKDLNMGVWEKKFRIDAFPEVLPWEIDTFRWDSVVGTVDNGQVLVFACQNDIYAYDLKTKLWDRTTTIHEGPYYYFCPRIHVNSLVQLKK